MEAKACEAVKLATRADLVNEGHSDWQASRSEDVVLPMRRQAYRQRLYGAVAAKVGHIDEHGVMKPNTFYYGGSKPDPVTHEMRASDLVYN